MGNSGCPPPPPPVKASGDRIALPNLQCLFIFIYCLRNPPTSDMQYRNFNVRVLFFGKLRCIACLVFLCFHDPPNSGMGFCVRTDVNVSDCTEGCTDTVKPVLDIPAVCVNTVRELCSRMVFGSAFVPATETTHHRLSQNRPEVFVVTTDLTLPLKSGRFVSLVFVGSHR